MPVVVKKHFSIQPLSPVLNLFLWIKAFGGTASYTSNWLNMKRHSLILVKIGVYGNAALVVFLFFLAPMFVSPKEWNSSTITLGFTEPEEDKSSIYSYKLYFKKIAKSGGLTTSTSDICGPKSCIATGLEANTQYRMWMRSFVQDKGTHTAFQLRRYTRIQPLTASAIQINSNPCFGKRILMQLQPWQTPYHGPVGRRTAGIKML